MAFCLGLFAWIIFMVVLEMHVSALSLVELTGCELITASAFVPIRLVYIKQ